MSIQGVRDRLKYAAKPSLKTAYRANRVFQPDTSRAFLLDTSQNGGAGHLVNYVLKDANTYEIPFVFSGEGVFVARFMKVSIKQRLFVTPWGRAVQMAANYHSRFPGNVAGAWTTKFSVFPKQPEQTSSHFAVPTTNFYWSMRDNTGWQLSDNLQSHIMLQPNTVTPLLPIDADLLWTPINDGGLYEFDTPWAFERDGQCVFQFRPTVPMLQFDSSIAGNDASVGLPFDDRESGVRNQAVTVTVALHGSRFRTDRDAMRAGAMTRIRRGEPG